MHMQSSKLPPFPAFPSTDRYVALGAIEDAVGRVGRAIEARETAALVIGPPGTGKSLLAALIAKQFAATHDVVILGDAPLADGEALLRHLSHRLGVDRRAGNGGDLHLALVDHLNATDGDRQGLVVIIDEAQKLPPQTIETLRMVTNISRHGEPRVFALLCGGPQLEDTLIDSSLESFTQRAATRCYLHPMNAEETRYFIRETIHACGAVPDATISAEAIAAIHHACSGVPRLINQLMTQAIDCAADADQDLIDEAIVDRAWAQLQQLPSPMVGEPQLAGRPSTVEFGELDGECEASDGEPAAVASSPAERNASAADAPAGDEIAAAAGSCMQAPAADIELETSTACWIDDEEDHRPSRHRPRREDPATESTALFGQFDEEEEISVGTGFVIRYDRGSRTPSNLESLLQAEIVSAGSAGGRVDRDTVPAPTLAMEVHCHDDDCVCGDDSDLLVIEDEVDVLPMGDIVHADRGAEHVSIDFQSMLARMRGVE